MVRWRDWRNWRRQASRDQASVGFDWARLDMGVILHGWRNASKGKRGVLQVPWFLFGAMGLG